jgi:hypothetical protein
MSVANNYQIDLESSFYQELQSILIDGVLNLSKTEIGSLYNYWNLNFDAQKVVNKFYNDSYISRTQNIPKEVILKGIDFPVWFGNFSSKKIVVLGIDPLRNIDAFNLTKTSDYKNDVIIGTPYALHESVSRAGSCKGYWAFIKGLVDLNNFVYCTDIFKTYYYNPSSKIRSYNDSAYTGTFLSSVHHQILMDELSLIQPDLIIVFGKIAHSFLTGSKAPKVSQSIKSTNRKILVNNTSVDVLTVLHLSRTTRGKNFNEFFNQNDINTVDFNLENRVHCAELYLSMLQQHGVI